MAQEQVNLTDDELTIASQNKLFEDPAVLNKLDSDSRRRLTRIQAQTAPPDPNEAFAGESAPVRFAAGVASALNPIPFANSLRTEGPIQTGRNMLAAQGQQFEKAGADFQQGRLAEGLGHTTAGILPVIGPAAAHAGETIAAGDVAGGIGQGVGLTAPFVTGPAIKGGRAVLDATGIGERVAGAAERGATARFVDATAPKVGQNKLRFANRAAEAAPDVLRNTTANTRTGLQAEVEAKLENAVAGLDAAADTRGANASMPTAPILNALRAARQKLVSESIKGSPLDPLVSGKDVVPTPNQGRVAMIDRAIAEVEGLGPTARFEALRRMRQAYDQIARVKYSPAVTPDYLAKQGDATAAADVSGALRDALAPASPETAAANADYALYKSVSDVLKATEETERARPTVGRTIMARGVGAAAGGASGGGPGAALGAILGPLVEKLANETKPAVKLMTSRRLMELADALRQNQTARVQSLTSKIVRQFPDLLAATPKPANLSLVPKAAEDQQDPRGPIGQR